jgi:cell division protein FtsQ
MSFALPRGLSWRRVPIRTLAPTRFPRRRVIVMTILWAAGILAFAGGLLQTKLFSVDRIDVSGSSQLSRDDVLSIAELKTGGSIAMVNAGNIEKRLEAHPWVLHARVDAKWPHVVSIVIVEQRAVAIAQTGDKKWVQLGPDGTVLSVADKPPVNLPAILHVSAPNEVGKLLDGSASKLLSAATLMPQSLQPLVMQMQDQNGVLRLGLTAGTIVTLGDSTNLNDKLMSAASVLSHTDPKTLAELDVSSPRFPVARPVGQTSSSKSSQSTTGTTAAPSTKTTQKSSSTAKSSTSTIVR